MNVVMILISRNNFRGVIESLNFLMPVPAVQVPSEV